MTYLEHVSTEILADHAEGLLGESESGRVEAHLAECDDCRATALLLASIPEILAADEVGPMPAVYASRIDAAIADLLVNEPPVPVGAPVAPATPIAVSPIGHDPATNNVVDLASRRKLAVQGLRRVGTVAAGVVLLIAGAALGIQTVGKDKDIVGPTGNNEIALPQISSLSSPYYAKLQAPKKTTPGPKGTRIDPKTGTMYGKDKVRFSDGTVVTLDSKGRPVQLIKPTAPKPQATEQPAETKTEDKPGKGDSQLATAGKGNKTPQPTRENPADAKNTPAQPVEGDPADPAASVQPKSTAAPEGQVGIARAKQGDEPSGDPYVSHSKSEYTEDNFAALVMDLVAAARRHSASSGSYEPSSNGSPTPTPTPSMEMPAGFRYPSASWAAFFQQPQVPQQPGRGPAEARLQARVMRCAEQIGFKDKVIAGDIGTWENRDATIVVVQSPNPEQVDGYVFWGNCSKDKPVTAESAQWTQRVDKPAENSTDPSPTPLRRTGSVQPASVDSTSRHYSR